MSGQAGIEEIVISPEMTEAGAWLISEFSDCHSADQLANQVFECMIRVWLNRES